MTVDTHAHIFSAAGPFAPGARYRPDYEAGIAQWLALWPAAGVTRGVLVQPSFLGADNGMLLAALGERPGTLRGVVVVDPAVGREALRRWDAAGVRGVRLNLLGVEDLSTYGNAEWTRLFGWMADLGWHLELQCEGERLAALLAVLPALPLALVIDHFGLPDPAAGDVRQGAGAVLRMAERRTVYVKLSAPYRLRGADPGKYAALYLAELGAGRLLWGSDWPWTNHERGRSYAGCLELFQDWIPSRRARREILERSPALLYGFDA